MCGIVGYVGNKQAGPILLDGLRRLEYRGYDSAGLAVLNGSALQLRKKQGKIDQGLAPHLRQEPVQGQLGIGHTRWATHGAPSDTNSHPHLDQAGRIALVHNGVIENCDSLRQQLAAAGHTFRSETDTEVLAHLVGACYAQLATASDKTNERLVKAVAAALKKVVGAYGIAVISLDCPGFLVGARRGSPLILGVGRDEHFLASDANALVSHTRQVVYLNEGDLVAISADQFEVTSAEARLEKVAISRIEYSAEAADRGGFAHYMLKEIFEQPATVTNALRGRIDAPESTAKFGGLNMSIAELRAVDRIVLTACGTSWHAALVGEYVLEELAHLPVEVGYASEFRYRNAPLEKNTLVVAITQSGETADTLAGLREAKRRGHKVLAICNVVGSTIAREADGGIYLHAGPEIGVASTKAFTSQVTVLTLFALLMARIRSLPPRDGAKLLRSLEAIPNQIQTILDEAAAVQTVARKFAQARNFFFLGRQYGFPAALEGALKLKEISYIHAEGYPAAEMKHGPIALIDEQTPTVVIIPSDSMYEKTLSNLEVVRARKGPIIAVATRGNPTITQQANEVLWIPETVEPLAPLLTVVPLQLFAYYIAVERGCEVDMPRNLAKSVTVE